MIPEKVCQSQTSVTQSSPPSDKNRTHTLSVSENGRTVGKFIYDRLSSAVSLVHELKILAQIKFTQIEIVDGSGEAIIDYSYSESSGTSLIANQKECFVQFKQIGKILYHQLEQCRIAQMPCSVVLLSVFFDHRKELNTDSALVELISIIGRAKGAHEQLFWYTLGGPSKNHEGAVCGEKTPFGTEFCIILPSSGLIKARLLVDAIKKQLREHDEFSGVATLCAGVGVKTTTDISAEKLLTKVQGLLHKSIRNDGKLMASTDISSNSQVTVEERSQLFMISKKTLK